MADGLAGFRAANGSTFARIDLPELNQRPVAPDPAPGQVSVVHVFATWCASCREELPALIRLAGRSARVRLLLVAVAEPEQRLRRFAEDNRIDVPILLDRDRAAARAWGVTALPTTFILDDRSRPRLLIERDAAWDEIDPGELLDAVSRQGPGPDGTTASIQTNPQGGHQ